ncbi:MAG TPA: hypothetical protein VFP59_17315 [Candidatus Angelobacter sp.]|nr:hypothetical protein [Candidatus Angelobacter sp.]
MQASSGITESTIQQANQAFQNQVSNQIARITSELKRMEDLLGFGMVDRRVLTEFRAAVDRVRTTGWQVERWLDGDERGLATLLTEQRIRIATTLATQLACEPTLSDKQFTGVRALRDAVQKLNRVLEAAE